MNYLEISSFNEAEKKLFADIENEFFYLNVVTNYLRTAEYVKCHNSFYHYVKK